LLESVQRGSGQAWADFQATVSTLKLQRAAARRDLQELKLEKRDAAAAKAAAAYQAQYRTQERGDVALATSGAQGRAAALAATLKAPVRIVMVTGFESFNQGLYSAVAHRVHVCTSCMCSAVLRAKRHLHALASRVPLAAAAVAAVARGSAALQAALQRCRLHGWATDGVCRLGEHCLQCSCKCSQTGTSAACDGRSWRRR
jgi:hypothetical protein